MRHIFRLVERRYAFQFLPLITTAQLFNIPVNEAVKRADFVELYAAKDLGPIKAHNEEDLRLTAALYNTIKPFLAKEAKLKARGPMTARQINFIQRLLAEGRIALEPGWEQRLSKQEASELLDKALK